MYKNIHAEKNHQNNSQNTSNVVQKQANIHHTKQGQQETIQAKQHPIQRKQGENLPIQAKQQPIQRKENNTGLPDHLKSGIENLSGQSMDDVKVHRNSDKPAQLKAHAYAQGTNIHLAPGQEQHLPHEAWHVVQQKQGRVQPTMQMKGNVHINDNPGLEREADVMGDKAVQMKTDDSLQTIPQPTQSSIQTSPIQRVEAEKAVTGLTHLVKMVDKTIFDGNQLNKVKRGDYVVIETDNAYDSRRGPNQETYREVDEDGPQHYVWYQVVKLNGIEMGPDVYIREDTFVNLQPSEKGKEAAWLTFGVDGKDLKALKSAVQAGYRRFDCAEGYNNTQELAKALKQEGVPRNEVEIVYKFDLNANEDQQALSERLMPVIKMFDGRIDALMVHNATNEKKPMTDAWTLMNQLKTAGLVGKVGMGNIKSDHAHLLKELSEEGHIDIVENSAGSVLADKDLQTLIKDLGADLAYYDVIDLVKEMAIPDIGNDYDYMKAGIESMVNRLQNISDHQGFQSNMILSSGNAQRQLDNLAKYGDGSTRTQETEKEEDVAMYVDYWVNSKNYCEENGPEVNLPPAIKHFLNNTDFNQLRETIKQSDQSILDYVTANNDFDLEQLKAIRVPSRIGLKKRYLDWTLDYILERLLGGVTCNHQSAQELIAALNYTVEEWGTMKGFLGEIV
ncbi:aldo/keto reductase [uncultured Microscilla sp.]|uniref:aldo/keto reductase n=1 Tax=uncultured Microscilla sp. TaxID=432653 RepID=UPI002607AEFF|nr:aldo/keto reductase [uncultured Microscilla sp.]